MLLLSEQKLLDPSMPSNLKKNCLRLLIHNKRELGYLSHFLLSIRLLSLAGCVFFPYLSKLSSLLTFVLI